MRRAHRRDGLQPEIAPDAVVDMHDQIARRQARRLGQEILGALPPSRRPDQPVAEHVLFGDHTEARRLEAMFQSPDRQIEPFVGPDLPRARDFAGVRHAAVGEKPAQPLARAGRIARDHHRTGPATLSHMARERPEQAEALLLPLGCEIPSDPPTGVDHAGAERARQHRELVDLAIRDRGGQRDRIEIHLARGTGL